jgi:general secretion pathway protein H
MSNSVLVARQQGFTLIEIMIVMVIVAMLAGAATLVIGNNQQRRQLENEARKLVAIMGLTQDEAIYQNIEIGLRIDPEGYSFRGLDEASLSWIALPQDFLKNREFPSWVKLDLSGVDSEIEIKKPDEERAGFYPQIIFFSSGESTPFQLTLQHEADKQLQYTIQSDGLNGIGLKAPGDDNGDGNGR